MKILRRLKGGGEWVSRCSRRLWSDVPNAGSSNGGIERVHAGGEMAQRAQPYSTIAAT